MCFWIRVFGVEENGAKVVLRLDSERRNAKGHDDKIRDKYCYFGAMRSMAL